MMSTEKLFTHEVHLKQGDRIVAILFMKQKELVQFKELYKKATDRTCNKGN